MGKPLIGQSPMMIYTCTALWMFAVLLNLLATPASAQTTEVESRETSVVDGTRNPNLGSPALTGERRPLYRLRKSDVVEIRFTFSPEFDQVVTVQPDGFVALRAEGNIVAEGLTLAGLHDAIVKAYESALRDPEVSVILKDFERPYFVAGGQVGRPGKYELRAPRTAAEAVAMAGGFTDASKHSQVVLFRRIGDGVVETHVLNLKAMLASRNLHEDLELRAGDMLFVPQNRISKIRKFLPASTLSTFFTPAQF
jgi:polysaccharide biosynthesis/export protein